MPDPLQEIAQVLAAAERTTAQGRWSLRAAAAEAVELHALDRLEPLARGGGDAAALAALRARAESALAGLQAADQGAMERLRARIRAGRYSPAGLRRAMQRHGGPAGAPGAYDGMDLLMQGLLRHGEPAEPRRPLGPDMVPYQPTPARAVLDLVDRAGIGRDDLLVDLGSGLGQVALLSALLSGARAMGVEWEPAYVDYARRCAAALAVRGVEFVQADAREAPLSDGTVFYLFTPFRDALLLLVLERLRAEAACRPLKICTYGPCTEMVSKQSWLRPASGAGVAEAAVAVFQSL